MILYMLGYEAMYNTLEEAKVKFLIRQGRVTKFAEILPEDLDELGLSTLKGKETEKRLRLSMLYR
jgi:hypothetical protein